MKSVVALSVVFSGLIGADAATFDAHWLTFGVLMLATWLCAWLLLCIAE